MDVLRTFQCEDCGQTTTRKRRPEEALVCELCGAARKARHNAETHQAAVERRQRERAHRPERKRPTPAPKPVKLSARSAALTGASNLSLADAFADLNRQERKRGGGGVH